MTKREKNPPTRRIPRDPAFRDDDAGPWPDFFNRIAEAPSPLSADDLVRLVRFWWTWPGRWAGVVPPGEVEWCGVDRRVLLDTPYDVATRRLMVDRRVLLDTQYDVATRRLMGEAEWRGMDSTALFRSAELCHGTLTQHPALGNWPEPGEGTWPECVEGAEMRPDQETNLEAASVLLERLAAVAGMKQDPELMTSLTALSEYGISRARLRQAVGDGDLIDYRPADKRGTTSPLLLDRAGVARLVARMRGKKKPALK